MTRIEAKDLFRKDKDSYGKPRGIMHKIDQIFDELEEGTVFVVWSVENCRNPEEAKKNHVGTGVNEKCLRTTSGDYIGIETGKFYSKKLHYHSRLYRGKIIGADDKNQTGMYHLYDDPDLSDYKDGENRINWKRKYLGALVTVREAHSAGEHIIYYCLELDEYFSDNEIEILK